MFQRKGHTMTPYNATDMIRAMHRDHRLSPDAEEGSAQARRSPPW